MAVILSNAIDSYMRVYKPNLNKAIDMITRVAVRQRFEEYNPTSEDKAAFDAENLQNLTSLYKEAEQKRALAIEQASETEKYEKEYASTLSKYNENIVEAVKRYEQIIFAARGGTVHSYLSAVLFPYIFLDGPLATHAKFFRAKLANGDFEFDALSGANLAHYLPELAMRKNLTDKQWSEVSDILGILLKHQMDTLIDLYITIQNPTSRRAHTTMRPASYSLSDRLISYLKDPSEICFSDTKSGKRPVVKNGKYVYVPGTTDYVMEKIPPGEMTICYSDGKFTCHDIKSVLRSIANDEEPLNPYTGVPYPTQFVNKMKARYADRLVEAAQWEEPEDPEFEPLKARTPPKVQTPKKVAVKEIMAKPKERARHKPPKKAKGVINKIGVDGDAFDILSIFDSTFKLWVKGAKGEQIEKTFEFTDNIGDDDVNVVVFAFDASDPETIKELDVNLAGDSRVYAIGINAEGISSLERTKLTRQAKIALENRVEHVFYVDGSDEEDLIAGLSDVAIDMEALKISGH